MDVATIGDEEGQGDGILNAEQYVSVPLQFSARLAVSSQNSVRAVVKS